MREIKLTQGKVALVSASDYEYLNKFMWYAVYNKNNKSYYAVRHEYLSENKYTKIRMHREIMGITNPKVFVDHENHNTLDNRRDNLRVCDNTQNQRNRKLNSNNSSGYKGVFWHSVANKWAVHIAYNKKRLYLGLFADKIEAAKAYNIKAIELFGEFACLNILY